MVQKILLLTKNYPPQIGGIERYSHDLYIRLRKEGHIVYLIKAGPRKDFLLSNKFLGSYILYCFYELFRLSYFFGRSISVGLYYSFKCNIIWSADGSISFLSYFLGIFSSARTRVTFHAKDVIWKQRAYQLIMPFFWRKIDEVICVSTVIKREALERGISLDKIEVQENSVLNLFFPQSGVFEKSTLLTKYGIPSNKIILFSIGRFVEKKGFHWFLSEVFPYLDANKYFYVLVGSGQFYLQYREIIMNKNLTNIILLDAITDPIEKARLFSTADYLIAPNIPVEGDREGSPIVLAEAFHYKLKAITSDMDGLAEQSINQNTIFLPPCSSNDWINYIQALSYRYEEKFS